MLQQIKIVKTNGAAPIPVMTLECKPLTVITSDATHNSMADLLMAGLDTFTFESSIRLQRGIILNDHTITIYSDKYPTPFESTIKQNELTRTGERVDQDFSIYSNYGLFLSLLGGKEADSDWGDLECCVLDIQDYAHHRHAAELSRLGQYLTQGAGHNNQVIIRIYSDHILNGLRIGVKYGYIASENVIIYHFQKQDPTPTSVNIDENGHIETWPTGFFDQMDKDFNILFEW